MTIKIWSRRSSSSAQKVFWTLEELGVEYTQIDAGRSYGIVDTPEYLAKNPNGLVPTLETSDGFVLWESNAIIRFLAASYGEGSLWPVDLRERASADRWLEWSESTPKNPINFVFVTRAKNWFPGTDEQVEKHIKEADTVLRRLAPVVAKNTYVNGDHLTIGDISLGIYLNRWFNLPVERPALPEVEDYYARLKERPAYVRNVVNAPEVV